MPDMWMNSGVALAEVPVNILPLIDATDYKTIEDAVAYNAAGLTLTWCFTTIAGAYSETVVTPTTGGGDYDWSAQGGKGKYTIKMPASGGASANNNAAGFGQFIGVATGVLPWRGPMIGFRPALLNAGLISGDEFFPVDAYRQKFSISGSDLTTKKPDGTTDTDYSPKPLTTDAAAVPIIGAG